MSLGFSYILAWHNNFQIWKDNRDKRTQVSHTIVMKGTKVPNLAVVSKLFINSMPA